MPPLYHVNGFGLSKKAIKTLETIVKFASSYIKKIPEQHH